MKPTAEPSNLQNFSLSLSSISLSLSGETQHDKAMIEEQLPAILMPLSSTSDCELLCGEDSSEVLTGDLPECSSDLDSSSSSQLSSSSLFAEEEEESIAVFIEHEFKFVPGFDYVSRFQSRSLESSTREEAIAWILKVNTNYFMLK